MKLHLVCDSSGSMGDGGKKFAMRTVVMAIAQWVQREYAGVEIRLCSWGSETRDFPRWSANEEFPAELLYCEGTSKWDDLIQLLGEQPDGKVLLFTDGFWPQESAKALSRSKQYLPLDTLRIIKIGADANPQLRGPHVFIAEDFFSAMDGWLEGGSA